jgi:ABC-type uncharacterized transport system auxiliary subunit
MVLFACGNSVPKTTYYRLSSPQVITPAPDTSAGDDDGEVLWVEELSVDAAYDDPQIAYRESPYKLDYYHYHRWSAPPGVLVSDFLRSAYANTRRFRRVVREFDDEAEISLTGRILSLEELDRTRQHWVANVQLELQLRDVDSGEVLWSTRIAEQQPLTERNPEGLAHAVSEALARVVERTAPEIVAAAAEARP